MTMFRTKEWLAGQGFSLLLRASIGIACYPADGTTPQDMVHCADELMYQVKQGGRDNVAVTGQGLMGPEKSRKRRPASLLDFCAPEAIVIFCWGPSAVVQRGLATVNCWLWPYSPAATCSD